MAFQFLQGLVAGPSTSNVNDNTDFYKGVDGSDDESDLEGDVLVDMDNDNDNSSDGDGNNGDSEDTGSRPGEWEWSDQLEDVNINPFTETSGPNHALPPDAKPYEYFSLLIEEDFYQHLADQTNLYARQQKEVKPNSANQWKECTAQDMKLFLFVNMMFGLHQLPHYEMFWSSDDLLRVPPVAEAMGKTRFENLSKFFHLRDNSAQQHDKNHADNDPIFKIRPLFDMVLNNSKKHYLPSRNVSIDEAMIAFTGRLFFKQYIKGKPCPWGIKAWCCAESKTGYLMNFSIYTGKSHNQQKSTHGQGYDVVMDMGKDLLNKNHHFFYDNFFASPQLATDLLQMGTYSCATIRTNRKGWPSDLKKGKKVPAGTTKFRQKGNLVATYWKDKREVTVLSTNCTPEVGTASRRTSAGPVPVPIPQPILTYNASMGGVDLHDQYRSYYPVGRRSKKWWRSLVWFLVQVATINAYIIYRASTNDIKKLTPVEFRLEVIRALRVGSARNRRATEFPTTAGQVNTDAKDHQIIRLYGRKMQCFQCRAEKRKTASNRGVETVFGCSVCKVHLCKGHCFAAFHNKL